jgi:TPR repeat protein
VKRSLPLLLLLLCAPLFGVENYLREGVLAYNQKDYTKAHAFFEIAIQKENSANAAYLLGKMYLYGEGVSLDYDKAIDLLEFSRENGNIPAGCYLSEAYMSSQKNTSYIAYGLMKGLRQHVPHCQKMLARYKSYTHF